MAYHLKKELMVIIKTQCHIFRGTTIVIVSTIEN